MVDGTPVCSVPSVSPFFGGGGSVCDAAAVGAVGTAPGCGAGGLLLLTSHSGWVGVGKVYLVASGGEEPNNVAVGTSGLDPGCAGAGAC